jgi:hypothetical protein
MELLYRGKHTIFIDEQDLELLLSRAWVVVGSGNSRTKYLRFRGTNFHRVVMGVDNSPGISIDHINHNGLDNRRANLRIATNSENQCNSMKRDQRCSSQYRGVHFEKRTQKYKSEIYKDGKKHGLGSFSCEIDAAIAYNEAAIRIHGEFACLNEFK